MRKTIAAIIVTGVYLLTNLLSGEAAGPVETYQSWSDELKSYTQSVCDEYNVDYSLALGVIYNESRFQSGLTHVNSNGTVDYGLMQVNEVNFDYLNKTLGVRSMSELLDDRTGIRCGVQLLAYHKQYLRKGRYTNQTHQQVLTYQSELASYLNSLQ